MSSTDLLHALYAGGQLPEWSIPISEARAVIGVPHEIETDISEPGINL